MSDGNPTHGDVDSAVDAAAGARASINVVQHYNSIENEVPIDRLTDAFWRHQGEPFHLDFARLLAANRLTPTM